MRRRRRVGGAGEKKTAGRAIDNSPTQNSHVRGLSPPVSGLSSLFIPCARASRFNFALQVFLNNKKNLCTLFFYEKDLALKKHRTVHSTSTKTEIIMKSLRCSSSSTSKPCRLRAAATAPPWRFPKKKIKSAIFRFKKL